MIAPRQPQTCSPLIYTRTLTRVEKDSGNKYGLIISQSACSITGAGMQGSWKVPLSTLDIFM